MNSILKSLKGQGRESFDRSTILKRQSAAHSIESPWQNMAPESMLRLLNGYSSGIGVPREFLFFPLITTAAAMMNTDTHIRLTPLWSEPAIIWNIVAARKGEKKSAAMRLIIDAVRSVENSISEVQEAQSSEGSEEKDCDEVNDEGKPVIHMTNSQFTFTKLHDQMKNNNGECLLLYDEIAALYDQLEHQSGGSQVDRKIFLSLNGGDSWNRSSKANGSSTMDRTHLNYTGFLQPTIAIAMLNIDDFDGFNDRHLAIICPKREKTYFEELISPEGNLLKLEEIFLKIRRDHEQPLVYRLNEDAKKLFISFYDSIEDRMDEVSINEDHRGVLSKCQGQVARLAMVIHCLYQSVEALTDGSTTSPIDSVISGRSMEYAIAIIELCISHKFALMPPQVNVKVNTDTVHDSHDTDTHDDKYPMSLYEHVIFDYPGRVKSLLECGIDEVEGSYVAQRKLMPPLRNAESPIPGKPANKYPVEAARAYLMKLADLGLGEIVKPGSASRKRKSTICFRKRKYDDLNTDAKQIIQSLGVLEDDYKRRKL